MKPEDYHLYFDKLHSKKADHEFNYDKVQLGLKTFNSLSLNKEKKPVSRQPKTVSYTIRQDTKQFKVWIIIRLITNVITTVLYPYYNTNGFPSWNSTQMIFLIFLESIFAIDIIMSFFL